jgi:hypothetical protein
MAASPLEAGPILGLDRRRLGDGLHDPRNVECRGKVKPPRS